VLAQNPEWKESGLVFTTNIGTPITPRNMLRHFKNKLTSIGLPNIRFHDLRHTTASLLLEKNVHPKIVSELLGHSTVTLTLNTYSHIIHPMSGVAAEGTQFFNINSAAITLICSFSVRISVRDWRPSIHPDLARVDRFTSLERAPSNVNANYYLISLKRINRFGGQAVIRPNKLTG
jgi:hypothetical protein